MSSKNFLCRHDVLKRLEKGDILYRRNINRNNFTTIGINFNPIHYKTFESLERNNLIRKIEEDAGVCFYVLNDENI